MEILSYNLRKHRAAHELNDLVRSHEPDVLCLQEADVASLPPQIGSLHLAESTKENRLGLAVYVRPSQFRVVATRTIGLKKSLHDRVLKPAHERVLAVHLHHIDKGRDVVVASFHAAPLTARNALRRTQISTAFRELHEWAGDLPTILVGDFNYPVFKERLSEELRTDGYELVMSDSRTYTRYGVFRGYYDFAAATRFAVEQVRTLRRGTSDHLPILVSAQAA